MASRCKLNGTAHVRKGYVALSFLASILPGVRDLRVPFAVGALWATVLLVLGAPHYEAISNYAIVTSLAPAWTLLPASVLIAAASFATYLLGLLAVGAQGFLMPRAAIYSLVILPNRSRVWIFDSFPFKRPSERAHIVISDSIQGRLLPISTALASLFPENLVINEFEMAAVKLSKEAPDQYQQYDRVQAEAEFRMHIAMPLIAFGIVIGMMLPTAEGLLLLAASLAGAVGLAIQGARQADRADELLATALYFGYTSTPVLDNLINRAELELNAFAQSFPKVDKDEIHSAWLCDYLADRSLLQQAHRLISRYRHPSRSADLDVFKYMKRSTGKTLLSLILLRDASSADLDYVLSTGDLPSAYGDDENRI